MARILSANPAAETLFGFGAAELIGRAGIDTLFPRRARSDIGERWGELIRKREPLFGLRDRKPRAATASRSPASGA